MTSALDHALLSHAVDRAPDGVLIVDDQGVIHYANESMEVLAGHPNGSLLGRKANALRQAGLKRITVSLDALDDATFKRMNDVDFPVAKVLEGIEAATAA